MRFAGIEDVYLRQYRQGQAEISLVAGNLGGAAIAAKLAKVRTPAPKVVSSSPSEVSVELIQ